MNNNNYLSKNRSKFNKLNQEIITQTRVIIAIGIALLLWASAFSAIQVCLIGYAPTEIAFLRCLIASVVLIPYVLFNQISMPRSRDFPLICLCGVLGFAIYSLMLNEGEQTVPAGIASFIISTAVVVIALLRRLFCGEKLQRLSWFGITLCIIGIGLISFNTSGDFKPSLGVIKGLIQIYIATFCFSFYSILQQFLLKKYTAIQLTTYGIWTGTIFLFLLAPKTVFSVFHAPITSTLSIIYMSLFPGIIAYFAWSYVLSKIPASEAGSYYTLTPVAALIIAWLWLGEVPTSISLLGCAIIFFGVILVNRDTLLSIFCWCCSARRGLKRKGF